MKPVTAELTAEPMVDIRDLFKIFEAGSERTVALRGVSMRVERAEFVALLGRSGSGKSTLLHVVAGLETASAGSAHVAGKDITAADEDGRARIREESIGLVLQKDNLIPYLTAKENVALPMRLFGDQDAQSRAESLLESVGLEQRLNHRSQQLSGGEAQRVSIALALARRPKLLLGDEITGELDSRTAAGVMDLLVDLHERESLTLIVVTHDPEIASRARRTVVMRDGRIEADG